MFTTSARDAHGHMYVRTLTNKVLGTKSHTDIFVILRRNHTINRLSDIPSRVLLFTGFRAVPAPVTGDERPFQIFSAGTLLADRLGQCAIGDKPLRNRGCFRHSSYFTSARSAHVVTMAVIAGAGFEPATFGLWARRATTATTLL